MDKKMIYVLGVVVIILVAIASVYFIYNNGDEETDVPAGLDEAELKVYGNIDGNRVIDENDANMIRQLIENGATASEYKMADANNDGVIDEADLDVVNKVIAGESTTIWHVNQFDEDGDGNMDQPIVSTKFPITSAIAFGTGNNFLVTYALGIIDEIKGATISSSVDRGLYGDVYCDESKVVKLGTSSTSITFEDGQAGSSNVIAEENVTAVIANNNRSNLENEADFENAGIDVIRVAFASANPETMTHGVMLIGLLFQKVDKALQYVDFQMKVLDTVNAAIDDVRGTVSAIASSMTGYISVGDSDYKEYIELAGGSYGMDGHDFGSTTSIKIVDYPEVYTYGFDKIIHFRTAFNYGQTDETNQGYWDDYTSAFSDWEFADTEQYITGGSLPTSLRVAYAAVAMYPDQISLETIDALHMEFLEQFFPDSDLDIESMEFLLYSGNMS